MKLALLIIDLTLGEILLFIEVVMMLQIALAFGATVWIWSILFRRRPFLGTNTRESLILFAAISYTAASAASVLMWAPSFLMWFGSASLRYNVGIIAKFGIFTSIIALALAVLGRGRGRVISAVSAGLMAMASLCRFYFS